MENDLFASCGVIFAAPKSGVSVSRQDLFGVLEGDTGKSYVNFTFHLFSQTKEHEHTKTDTVITEMVMQ